MWDFITFDYQYDVKDVYQTIFQFADVQQHNSAMSRQAQLIESCRNALANAAQDHVDFLTNLFTDPHQYSILLSTISNPHVAFMFCLTVKKHLKVSEDNLVYPQASSTKHADDQNHNFDGLIQIAESTQFCQYLRSRILSSQNRDQLEAALYCEYGCDLNQQKVQSLKSLECSKIWYESLIFMNLLICSKCRQPNKENPPQIDLEKGLDRLRDQLLAKLLVNIYLETNHFTGWSEHFEDILKKIVIFDEQNEYASIGTTINIINQLIIYLQEEEEALKIKKLIKFFGKRMMSILMVYLEKLLKNYIKLNGINLISKVLSAFNSYLNLTTTSVNCFTNYGCSVNVEEVGDIFARKTYRTDEPINFHFSFVREAYILIGLVSEENFCSISITCMQIIDKITLFTFVGQENQEMLCNEQYLRFQTDLSSLMKLVIAKWIQLAEKNRISSNKNGDYYLQCLIINVLGNIFNNYMPFFFNHKDLLHLVVHQYCLEIIIRAPIRISQGEKSVINSTFYFLQDIAKVSKRALKQPEIIDAVRHLNDKFLVRCCEQTYDEQFVSYQDEVQACRLFFTPVVELAEKIYFNEGKLISDNHFTIMYDHIHEKKCPDRTFVMDLFMVEMIKSIDSFQNSQYSSKKCVFLLELLEIMSKSKNIQYLMLLDAVSDQIVENNSCEIDQNSSSLCFLITRKTSYTLPEFTISIVNEITEILLTSQSLYHANYSIHLLARMCQRLKRVESCNKEKGVIRHSVNLIHEYMSPVVTFVRNLNLTVLENTDNYEQRGKIFQLICYVGINEIEDTYKIYGTVRANLFKAKNSDQLKYVIDVAGLLSASGNKEIEQVILELIFIDLKKNGEVFNIFTAENLAEQIYFNVYTNFLLKIMRKLISFTEFNAELIADFQQIFQGKLDVLAEIYDETNFNTIHEVYLSFTLIEKMYAKFPRIPDIIYSSTSSCRLTDWMFNNLARLFDIQEVKKLYRNTFDRKSLIFESHLQKELQDDITQSSQLSYYLFLMADFLEIQDYSLFFDHQAVVETLFTTIYRNYREGNSSAFTLDSFGFDDFESDSQNQTVNYLQQFYNKVEYKKKISYLMKASHIFTYISTKYDKDFAAFADDFLPQMNNLLESFVL